MAKTLYVANFPPAATEETLSALFGEYGEVTEVEFGADEKSQTPYALVTIEREKDATKAYHKLNGHKIEDHHLAVSYPEMDPTRELMNKQEKELDKLAAALEETEKVPVRRLRAMARLCGTSFMKALLEETEAVEKAGGLMTADGSRRRSKGGVFFYLAKYRVSDPVRRMIYNRKGKIPTPEQIAEAEAAAAAAAAEAEAEKAEEVGESEEAETAAQESETPETEQEV